MTKNILLAGGCSYTDSDFNESFSVKGLKLNFPKWPDLLAKKLNLQAVNLGQSGAGNSEISNTVSKYIIEHHEQIKLICVLWTEWDRYSLFFNAPNSSFHYMQLDDDNNDNRPYHSINKEFYNIWTRIQSRKGLTEGEGRDLSKENYIFYNLLMYKNLELLCNHYNIRFKFMQGMRAFDYEHFHPWLTHHKIKSQDLNYFSFNKWDLELENFIGWPLVPSQGNSLPKRGQTLSYVGLNLDEYLVKHKMICHEQDTHPNKEGHELIAKIFEQHL